MKKIYKVEVDCANCANLMEKSILKIDGIKNANINFMMQKMTIEYFDDADENEIIKKIISSCKKIEDEFEIEL